MGHSSRTRACAALATIVAFSAAALATASPASAALSATLENLTLPAVTYSHQSQAVSGRTVLTASDTTEGNGWHVTEHMSDLQYSGLHNGSAIPASNLSVVSVEDPVAADGSSDAVDSVGGPKIPDISPVGSLDTPRVVLEAEQGHGLGTYTQGITLSLTVPAGTRAGTYTGTITTTVTPGPTP